MYMYYSRPWLYTCIIVGHGTGDVTDVTRCIIVRTGDVTCIIVGHGTGDVTCIIVGHGTGDVIHVL